MWQIVRSVLLGVALGLSGTVTAQAQLSSTPFYGESTSRFEPVLFAARPVPELSDGSPRVFSFGDETALAYLTLAARSRLERIATTLRPSYRAALSFLFYGPPTQPQRFVVFLHGHPEIPALNFCEAIPGCECRAVYVVDPERRVTPLTIRPCLSKSQIWLPPS
jgi:hypothetical protein